MVDNLLYPVELIGEKEGYAHPDHFSGLSSPLTPESAHNSRWGGG